YLRSRSRRSGRAIGSNNIVCGTGVGPMSQLDSRLRSCSSFCAIDMGMKIAAIASMANNMPMLPAPPPPLCDDELEWKPPPPELHDRPRCTADRRRPILECRGSHAVDAHEPSTFEERAIGGRTREHALHHHVGVFALDHHADAAVRVRPIDSSMMRARGRTHR